MAEPVIVWQVYNLFRPVSFDKISPFRMFPKMEFVNPEFGFFIQGREYRE
jgi:hypothetical protein